MESFLCFHFVNNIARQPIKPPQAGAQISKGAERMPTTPTKKTASAKAAAAKAQTTPAIEAEATETDAATGTTGEAGGHLRLKDLVEKVVASSGAKAKEVRDIVTATLTELAAALERGDALNLPELGKVRVARRGDDPEGTTSMVLKLRKGGPGGPRRKEGQEALAEASE